MSAVHDASSLWAALLASASQPRAAFVSGSQEVLAGLVERVTFHNAENRFCVLRARARGHRDVPNATIYGESGSRTFGPENWPKRVLLTVRVSVSGEIIKQIAKELANAR